MTAVVQDHPDQSQDHPDHHHLELLPLAPHHPALHQVVLHHPVLPQAVHHQAVLHQVVLLHPKLETRGKWEDNKEVTVVVPDHPAHLDHSQDHLDHHHLELLLLVPHQAVLPQAVPHQAVLHQAVLHQVVLLHPKLEARGKWEDNREVTVVVPDHPAHLDHSQDHLDLHHLELLPLVLHHPVLHQAVLLQAVPHQVVLLLLVPLLVKLLVFTKINKKF